MSDDEHPNSIRRCFKHGYAGRILHFAGPMEAVAGPTPTDAVCPRGTYGDKGKAARLRAAPTALLFERAMQSIQNHQNQIRDQHDCSHTRDGKQ